MRKENCSSASFLLRLFTGPDPTPPVMPVSASERSGSGLRRSLERREASPAEPREALREDAEDGPVFGALPAAPTGLQAATAPAAPRVMLDAVPTRMGSGMVGSVSVRF